MKRNKGKGRCFGKAGVENGQGIENNGLFWSFESPLRAREWGFWMNSER